MELLKGNNIGILPFNGLTKVSDLIAYEGPILSHFRDKYQNDFLFYWVDYNESYNRWLVFQVTKIDLYRYLLRKISLQEIFLKPINNCYYSVEIGKTLNFENIKLLFEDSVPTDYVPEFESFYNFNIPSIYSSLLSLDDNYFIEQLREKAVFFKVKPSKRLSKSALSLTSASKFLDAINKSFENLTEFKFLKDYSNRFPSNKGSISKLIKGVKDSLEPKIVEVAYSSFAVAICPNTIASNDFDLLTIEWKNNLLQDFKDDVVNIDNLSADNINTLVNKYYDIDTRNKIFKPLIDLYKDESISIDITDKNFKTVRKIKSVRKEYVDLIIVKKEETSPETEFRIATIEVNKNNPNNRGKTVNIFAKKIEPIYATDLFRISGTEYNLTRKIYAEYIIEEEIHSLQCYELSIHVFGENFDETEKHFFEEFDFIYNRYNELDDEQLSVKVKFIKEVLNTLVIKK